ncbi:alkaline ceramidase ydc1 [Coemansia sp. Benny D115]|nr:alkaline ceramidase ydc1 [Coemansia sp. Benny D115]
MFVEWEENGITRRLSTQINLLKASGQENYVACKYIAEFWNTTTNLAFFALAAFGIWKVRSSKQEYRFVLCYLGMLIVGLGSWLFHMTLQYQWQLADELPTHAKTGTDVAVALWLFAYSAVVTLVYLRIRKPVFHQVAYGLEVALILVRSVMHQVEIRRTNWHAYREMRQLFWLGVGSFGGAFVLWNMDNVWCAQLRAVRSAVPWAVAPLFQLHAYWHVGTALGCYVSIVFQQYLRLVKLERAGEYRLRWLAATVPYIEKHGGGSAKRD